jgi:predicted 3-demethylubiquinone-9 3-methyltransferase (glyoxalase superfamily)
MTRVSTHIMFQGQAAQALALYASIFPGFNTIAREDYGTGDMAPPGTVKLATIEFNGSVLQVIDSPIPHDFDFTPSMSLFVDCASAKELTDAFAALSQGGEVMMPPDNYGFSQQFSWCRDRFGLSWQLNLP